MIFDNWEDSKKKIEDKNKKDTERFNEDIKGFMKTDPKFDELMNKWNESFKNGLEKKMNEDIEKNREKAEAETRAKYQNSTRESLRKAFFGEENK